MSHGCRRVAATALFTLVLAAPAAANVYWADGSRESVGRTDPKPTSLGSNPNTLLDWVQSSDHLCGVDVNATHVYFGTAIGDKIRRAAIAAPDVVSDFATVTDTCGIALDANYLYYAHTPAGGGGGSIGRLALSDGSSSSPFPVSLPGGAAPCDLAVDATHIYFKVSNGGVIGRMNLDGTGLDTFWAVNSDFGCGIDVDATYVYYAMSGPRTGSGGCPRPIPPRRTTPSSRRGAATRRSSDPAASRSTPRTSTGPT
jgi:hypothetical protein